MPSPSAFATLALLTAAVSPQDTTADTLLNGVWMSRGYGYVAQVKPEGTSVYDVAGGRCWPNPAATQAMTGELAMVGTSGRIAIYRPGTGETAIMLDRLEALPQACLNGQDVSPIAVLDAFWATMQDHYAFFDLYGVDWASRRTGAEAALNVDAGDQALFEVLASALEGLNDPHLTLSAQINHRTMRRTYSRPRTLTSLRAALDARNAAQGTSMGAPEFYRRWMEADARDLWNALHGPRGRAFDGRMIWGRLEGGVGYIGLNSLHGFSASGETADDVAALGRELDRALAALGDSSGLIIDLSQNLGGTDAAALAFAGRFADQSRAVWSKRAYNAGGPPPEPVRVGPVGARQYLGPTVVLTSDLTMSAAEVLALSLRAFPHVIHAGGTTRGGFSDVLEKTLPNGWRLTLSNEIYLTPEGEAVEGVGLTPAVTIDIFPAGDVWRHRLAAVREATLLFAEGR